MVYGDVWYEDPASNLIIQPVLWFNHADISQPGWVGSDTPFMRIFVNITITLRNITTNVEQKLEWIAKGNCYEIELNSDINDKYQLETKYFSNIKNNSDNYIIDIQGLIIIEFKDYIIASQNYVNSIYVPMSQIYICETVMDSNLITTPITNNLPVINVHLGTQDYPPATIQLKIPENGDKLSTESINSLYGYNSIRVNMVFGDKNH